MTTRTSQAARMDRPAHEVDLTELLPGLLNHDGQPITKARIAVNSVKRLARAAAAAHAHVEASAPASIGAKANYVSDPNVLANAKSVEGLYESFREHEDPKYTLFPTAEWMREHLTPSAIAVLANAYCEAEKAEGPVQWPELTRENVFELVETCARHSNTALPEAILMRYEREWLTQWIVVACVLWQQERRRVCDVLRQLDADSSDHANELLAHLKIVLGEEPEGADSPDHANCQEDNDG